MAASTTSLPETPGGARNWDYRYTWIRDTGFMLRSLYRLGFDWEALEYFAFVLESVTQGKLDQPFELQIMYGIGGERDLTERTLDHLSGYEGRSRSGSATAPGISTRTTCGACCSTRLNPPAPEGRPKSSTPCGKAWPDWWTRRWPTAATPTRASGRFAASRSISPPRPSCAGWRPTGAWIWRVRRGDPDRAERWRKALMP